ncbi:GNAT family N-acetyltransferase [Streptomyces sp. WAC08241]|uniref:GNAT family N-acetyltransferase n=1 Tax=Streptomyces sp. WAC08241 TaxID=2487421 RepID=UPI000F7B789D|nr:GNAT family N-acetyltransferase [Streptomyces sp. WAC08241]RSS35554.1 N-acetyltransferase [Streptomyces sp. WAC08241]
MTEDHRAPALSVGAEDAELGAYLEARLDAYNLAATGTTPDDQGELSVKAVDAEGALVGGLTASTWGGLLSVDLLWVREDSRADGWGSRLLNAAEVEARRRGCDRACVSSYTFQAPGFYERHGYVEKGRVPGVPGGAEDVYLYKEL